LTIESSANQAVQLLKPPVSILVQRVGKKGNENIPFFYFIVFCCRLKMASLVRLPAMQLMNLLPTKRMIGLVSLPAFQLMNLLQIKLMMSPVFLHAIQLMILMRGEMFSISNPQ